MSSIYKKESLPAHNLYNTVNQRLVPSGHGSKYLLMLYHSHLLQKTHVSVENLINLRPLSMDGDS